MTKLEHLNKLWTASETTASRCSTKIDIYWRFRKFHGKITVPESLFHKVEGLKPATLLKWDSNTGGFLWNFPAFRKIFFNKTTPGNRFCIILEPFVIHGFTILVPVLIWLVFWQLLQRNGKILSKSLFWNEQTQRADSRWQQESYFTSTLINFSIIYFQIGIIFQLNYYQ